MLTRGVKDEPSDPRDKASPFIHHLPETNGEMSAFILNFQISDDQL